MKANQRTERQNYQITPFTLMMDKIIKFIKSFRKQPKTVSASLSQKFKTVQQIAKENECKSRTVQKWCQANGVPYIGYDRGKQYLIYPEHEEKFKEREKPGRRWHTKKTKREA